jgi:surfactin synthase thioesterase subunit
VHGTRCPSAESWIGRITQGEATIVALADRIIEEQNIGEGDFLIGTSLGGIVVCEIANRIEVAGLDTGRIDLDVRLLE